MAGDTLAELLDLTYLRADIAADDPKFPVPTMTRIINNALRQISTEMECYWLQTSASLSIVAATTSYPLTGFTRFHKARRLVDNLHNTLRPVNGEELEGYLSETAKPSVWVIQNGSLMVGASPDTAYTYTFHFFQYEAALSQSGDTPTLPSVYSDFLAVKAGIIAATRNRDTDMVALLREELKDWKRRIADDMRQMTPLPHVRVRPR